ncbi:MAG: hypothetical protein JGK12_29385 [Microcoleus sp. PH2017_01_SCD_O_A]|nr:MULTISPECIES: hypothetical protein [unclassified Microcoleus]MCC3442210.1 hypothetical protein [Microcoleus sp. PH2017_03_ELD_O_A]MCC3467606.1 hypothetical protein [Microcoleus sp. PH2017_06_SFM_O_A]MCC3486257.1 hypothetical protein [Microcoleus sp. PH2017_14_LAR_D_A]MCC3504775.1 hypothetical protein [Microcoleus sp. PH2017_19_SFW_U_A]MCC3508858.1 hypothetical protein [Microcoleus sp. PH2017_17_BER_D_A]MCC3547002.1 hypothetical protein [Microcoleus sp. PH2017_24_DOB_U_A]MCC3585588.1 hypot
MSQRPGLSGTAFKQYISMTRYRVAKSSIRIPLYGSIATDNLWHPQ